MLFNSNIIYLGLLILMYQFDLVDSWDVLPIVVDDAFHIFLLCLVKHLPVCIINWQYSLCQLGRGSFVAYSFYFNFWKLLRCITRCLNLISSRRLWNHLFSPLIRWLLLRLIFNELSLLLNCELLCLHVGFFRLFTITLSTKTCSTTHGANPSFRA